MAKKKIYKSINKIHISAGEFIMPYFVIKGNRKREPIASMPGIARLTIDNLVKEVRQAKKLGINKVFIFGVCPASKKNNSGSYAYSAKNIVSEAVSALKEKIKGISIITDVCLCAYTTHGHCGILRPQGHPSASLGTGKATRPQVNIDNKKTLSALAKIALLHAQAGADWVAPSAMAEKQVLAIRQTLDRNGFKGVKIMGYSAKFCSNFYGPFRDAANSAPGFGDRSSYQLDSGDTKQAIREIRYDIKEGADAVMVKPALSYLDIIKTADEKFKFPLAAYNVSGEYALVKFGARQGLWDEKRIVFEIITSIKRAGADFIITYHAKDIAKWIKTRKYLI